MFLLNNIAKNVTVEFFIISVVAVDYQAPSTAWQVGIPRISGGWVSVLKLNIIRKF